MQDNYFLARLPHISPLLRRNIGRIFRDTPDFSGITSRYCRRLSAGRYTFDAFTIKAAALRISQRSSSFYFP